MLLRRKKACYRRHQPRRVRMCQPGGGVRSSDRCTIPLSLQVLRLRTSSAPVSRSQPNLARHAATTPPSNQSSRSSSAPIAGYRSFSLAVCPSRTRPHYPSWWATTTQAAWFRASSTARASWTRCWTRSARQGQRRAHCVARPRVSISEQTLRH